MLNEIFHEKFNQDLVPEIDGCQFLVKKSQEHGKWLLLDKSDKNTKSVYLIEDCEQINVIGNRTITTITIKRIELGYTQLDIESFGVIRKSNLEILLLSQLRADSVQLLVGQTTVLYNLIEIPHFQTEINGIDVRIPWFTSLFEVKVKSSLGYSAGQRLIDLMADLLEGSSYLSEKGLYGFLGISGKGIILSSFLASKFRTPCSYSREAGAVMPKNWLEVTTESHYNESKTHFISKDFLNFSDGVIVVVDDAIATGGTLSGFFSTINKHREDLIALTILDLPYAKGIKDFNFNHGLISVFTQQKPENSLYSKDVINLYYND